MPAPFKPTPRWHPIASLPLIARVIDGQLKAAEEQRRLLLQARPGSLDEATIGRVARVFTEEIELLEVNQEQLDRWHTGALTAAQRGEVERLSRQVVRNREVAVAILALAEELKTTIIEAILARSDLELGLEEMLADPEFVAELDEMSGQLERGELELHPLDEARAIVERRMQEHERGGLK
jgi:hypothetical protein